MIPFIDAFLNRITMYRLVLYYLIFLVLIGLFASAFGLLSFSPIALVCSVLYLVAVCLVTNKIFSSVFGASANVESAYITALILALIITPIFTWDSLLLLTWAGILSMASKYIVAIRKKHLFNPAAFAVTALALAANQSATWWVGTMWMFPVVLIGGLFIVRKQRQLQLVSLMVMVAVATVVLLTFMNGVLSVVTLRKVLIDSPLIFFATIMFTEPFTMPPAKKLQFIYATLVGILFAPQLHIGSIFSTPELALLVGNIFSYIVSPKIRRILRLQEKIQIAPDIFDFVFIPDTPFDYHAGQYMEWTLPHETPDFRGNRRYFTLASAPSEQEIRLGVKFYPEPSSFKQALFNMKPGDSVVASQLAGEFTLPKDPNQRCIFIAGGIGVTPYRSMIVRLLNTNETRPITLFYASRTTADFVYTDIFEEARQRLRIPTIYVPSDTKGFITPELIATHVPEYTDALFYISGPQSMITAFEDMLVNLGIPKSNIKTDFFPGLV